MKQRTLLIVKPDAVSRNLTGRILAEVESRGFGIRGLKRTLLKRAQAEHFYAEHQGKPFYEPLCEYMTSGPVVLVCLEADEAVVRLRETVGATDPNAAAPLTIRRMFAVDKGSNSVHASDSPASAERELGFFGELLAE
ncbi:MAG: nucleoside-diphosphate kinase [Candidatus Eisenbacteria bacterium]|nr:nucleoside-diphosphate kinase [Candidatus Eisenbacteria bacterium]